MTETAEHAYVWAVYSQDADGTVLCADDKIARSAAIAGYRTQLADDREDDDEAPDPVITWNGGPRSWQLVADGEKTHWFCHRMRVHDDPDGPFSWVRDLD